MNPSSTTNRPDAFTFAEIIQLSLDFEALLRPKCSELEIRRGSPFETAALAAIQMIESFRDIRLHDRTRDYRHEWRQAIALGDMLRKVMTASNLPFFGQLWPHVLLLLGEGNIALNLWNPKEDSDADKIFELYMALVLAPLCSDLVLDHPVRSAGGKNPDVIAQLDRLRWAFSCKVMHSDSSKTFLDRVRDGVAQIKRSDADCGVVVVSLKNQLPHDKYWGAFREKNSSEIKYLGPYDPEAVVGDILTICHKYHEEVISELLGGPYAFNELFNGTQAIPTVLLHLCTSIGVGGKGQAGFRFIRIFYSLNADPLQPNIEATLNKLNESLHDRVR